MSNPFAAAAAAGGIDYTDHAPVVTPFAGAGTAPRPAATAQTTAPVPATPAPATAPVAAAGPATFALPSAPDVEPYVHPAGIPAAPAGTPTSQGAPLGFGTPVSTPAAEPAAEPAAVSTPAAVSPLAGKTSTAAPRPDLDRADAVVVPSTAPVTLPDGTVSTSTPGMPVFPMPSDVFGPLRAYNPERDRYGRYMMPSPTSGEVKPFTRATTVAHALPDVSGSRRNLENYKSRTLLKGILAAPELLQGLDTSLIGTVREKDLNKVFEEIADNAELAGGGADKREFGTAVHAWTEALDHGQCTFADVPEMFRPYVAVFETALADARIEIVPEYVERIVYNPETDTIGTADRIFRIYNADGTSKLVIGDIKTSSNISYSWLSISAQLAQYADATHIWSEDGTHWEPMPPVDPTIGVIAEVPALPRDRDVYCDLHIISLDVGRQANKLAVAVRDLNRTGKRNIPLQQQAFAHSAAQAEALLDAGEVTTTLQRRTTGDHVGAPSAEGDVVWDRETHEAVGTRATLGMAPLARGPVPGAVHMPGTSASAPTAAPATTSAPATPSVPEAVASPLPDSTPETGDALTESRVAALLGQIAAAVTVEELNAMWEPSWGSPAGAPLMEAAQSRALAIQRNAALAAG